MPLFTKESLESLRQRVDLAEVLSSHIDLKRSGASYKGLCPFHDEKTPSFMIQKGDSHYHCFGCGAHGDAIQFLMSHLKMSFTDAIESLAQRFNVPLQRVEEVEEKRGPSKTALKEALQLAAQFYQFYLLHTAAGHEALNYLYGREINLDFINRFQIGLAPREQGLLRKILHAKFIKDEIIEEAGLIYRGKEGSWRDFFHDRITFPVCDATGAVIGFSARKFKEETFGGKYINTAETPLFKKSRILFGLNQSRKRIAKERKVIIVEGQIDALRLISYGFNITVAAQGTAFGENHAKELLALGINEVFLALDSDAAGKQAACKIGDLFQKEGIQVRVIELPLGTDPDAFLRNYGPDAFLECMKNSRDYLSFLVKTLSEKFDIETPAGKNELAQILMKQIRAWNHTLMVHESLRKVAHLLRIPEDMMGVGQDVIPNIYVKKSSQIGIQTIDADKIWETDFLCSLIAMAQSKVEVLEIAQLNLKVADLRLEMCRKIYQMCLDSYMERKALDFLFIISGLEDAETQHVFSELLNKKINKDHLEASFYEAVQKILHRNWVQSREELRIRIQSAENADEDVTELLKQLKDMIDSVPSVKKL